MRSPRHGADALAVFTYSLRPGCQRRGPRADVCREHGVDAVITSTLAAGVHRATPATAGMFPRSRRSASRCSRARRRAGHAPTWLDDDCGTRPARRRQRCRDPRVRRPHRGPDVRVQGSRRRDRTIRQRDRRHPGGDPERTDQSRSPRRAPRAAATHRPTEHKRVAIVLSAYPTNRSRLGNAVGLDTPASAVALLRSAARRRVSRRSDPGRQRHVDGRVGRSFHVRRSRRSPSRSAHSPPGLDVGEVVRQWFSTVGPEPARGRRVGMGSGAGRGLRARRRALSSRASTRAACWSPSSRREGSAPIRSARTTRPDLPPPHHYLAFYQWLASAGRAAGDGAPPPSSIWASTARLEWLPGQGARTVGRAAIPTSRWARCRCSIPSSSTIPAKVRKPSGEPTRSSSTICRRR